MPCGLDSGLDEIRHRLLPQLASQGVMCEQLYLLPEPIVMKRLDGIDDPRVQLATPLLQLPPIGDVLRERMLEAVLEVGKKASLVDELGGLQAVERAAKRLVR